MKIHTLYTGGGVSLSTVFAEGRRVSAYVRLVADEGMGITDGVTVTACIDTKTPEAWTDCELPPEPVEATAEDYEDALGRFGV